jgi:hypothetical protein
LGAAIGLWLLFTLSILIVPSIGVVIWAHIRNVPLVAEAIVKNPEAVLVNIAAIFVAHAMMVIVAWGIATHGWTERFTRAVGWTWHPRFKFRHSAAVVILLYGISYLLTLVLPSGKTEFDELLETSQAVRIIVAVVAVVSAPFIEELVYRGILYPAIHVRLGPVAAVFVVSGLFALVHLPQYWGSTLIVVALLLLSFVLTGVRALTGRLLPCYVIHLFYNGIGSALILAGYA